SKAYFDGFIDQVERIPFDLSRHNMYKIPSGVYRQFVEQKIELERNKKDVHDIKEEMKKFRQEMNARSVRQENTVPIIVGQHYGLSDFSAFRSMQGGPSSFMNMGTPPKFQTPMRSQPGSSDWQRQMPKQSASQYWQPSPHPGSYNSFGRVPSHMGRPNLQTTIDTQHDVDGIVDQGKGLVPFEDAIQERDTILMYTHHNRLHVYVSRVELSILVVAELYCDETNKRENQEKPSCAKMLFD
ncbi:hypothetical protein Tco_0029358, partial [Tanacetum coccineum]